MKKILFFAALVLGMASCQTEPEGLDVMVGGEQEVMLNVSLPESTRSASSAGFDFTNFESNGQYDLRFILEIAYNGHIYRDVKTSETTSATFPVRLVPGREYTFTVWADLVKQGSNGADLHYNILDNAQDNVSALSNITFKEWAPNVETRDAFCGRYTLASDKSVVSIPTITLTRPFAKVRVVSTDIANVRKFGIEPNKTTVTYRVPMYTAFNAVTGEVAGNATENLSYTYDIKDSTYSDNTNELTVFADYILVSANTIKFDLDVKQNDASIKNNSFNTEIPVEANKVTSIVGDVLTEGGNVSVTVDGSTPGQKETINYVDNAESLQEIINNSEEGESVNITLGDDIDLGALAGILSTRAEKQYGLEVPAGKSVVLDLNGCTISQTKECTTNYSMIVNKGNLTITDNSVAKNGTISFKDTGAGDPNFGWGSYTLRNEGTLVVENGTIKHLGEQNPGNGQPNVHMYCAIFQYSGKSTINGGVISTPTYRSVRLWSGDMTINGGEFEGQLWLQAVNNNSKLTINGGTFAPRGNDGSSVFVTNDTYTVNFAVNGGHFTTKIGMSKPFGCITGGTFTTVAKENTAAALINDDYAWVEAENGLWTVALKNVIAKIGEVEYRTLQKAFDAVEEGANTIVLVDDVNVNAAVVLAEGKTATLDLNGKTLTATGYAIENNGTLTITGDGTINGIVYGENGTTTVENGTFNPADGGAYVFLNSTAGKLIINGGTINAGSSYPVYSYNENNKLIINDVIINGKFGCVNAYGTNGSVEINGGTFQMTGVQGNTSHITYFSSNIVATINGGTFKKIGDISMSATGGGGICVNGGANLTINGGTFAGDHDDVYNYGGTISVKGGEYKFKPDFVADGYKVVEENGAYKVVSDPVAKIGGTEYNSLQAAIEAVEEGETIVMQRDLNITTPAYGQNALNHAKAVSFTLDLNGKTLSADTGNSVFRYNITQTSATSNITVTFKNGTITSGDKTWCTVMAAGLSKDVKAIFNLENLTINASKAGDLAVKAWDYAVINAKNVTVNATKCAGGFYAVGGEVVLTNCTVNQKGLYTAPYLSMAVAVSNGGKMTVNSGNYTAEPTAASEGDNQGTSHGSWCAGVMNSGGELIINGGTFANGNFGDDALATAARGLIFGDTASNIVINDGNFNALKTVIDYQNNLGVQPNPNIVINGGNFSANPAVVTSYGGVVLAEGKVAAQGADGRWTLVDGVMDEAGLKAAFEQGGNIVLGADITVSETIVLAEGKTVVLDLNGKTLAAVDMNTIKNNGGNLTIKNGTVTRTGDVVGYSVNNASGEISVVDATIERGLYTSGSKMTATNANISHEQSSRHAIYAWNCEVTINSGTFHNDNAGNATLMASGSSVVTINGGTFSIADGRSTIGWTSSMIDQNSTAQVIVKGGLFNGGFRINSADTRLTIEGGEFNTNNGSAFTDYSGTKVVKGGKFTDAGAQNWAKKYIAEGYEMNANGVVVAK